MDSGMKSGKKVRLQCKIEVNGGWRGDLKSWLGVEESLVKQCLGIRWGGRCVWEIG